MYDDEDGEGAVQLGMDSFVPAPNGKNSLSVLISLPSESKCLSGLNTSGSDHTFAS